MTDDDTMRMVQAAVAVLERALARLNASPNPRWLRLKQAAAECGWHSETMTRKARMHGLGRRDGRTWWIDMTRVEAWRAGKPYDRIPPVSASSGKSSDAPDDSAEVA